VIEDANQHSGIYYDWMDSEEDLVLSSWVLVLSYGSLVFGDSRKTPLIHTRFQPGVESQEKTHLTVSTVSHANN
jgi:hypothetical protein